MAKRLSLNEGSLLRRTLLHVAVFVLGTAAFIALASLVLTTVADKLLTSGGGDHESASEEGSPSAASTGKPQRPPRRKGKLSGTSPAAPAADPAKTDDDEE